MIAALATTARQMMVRGVLWMHRHARLVALAGLLVGAGAAAYTVEHISISTDTSEMLSSDLEFQKRSKEISRAFPQLDATLLVVVDGDNPELAEAAARNLAGRLRANPRIFPTVQDMADDPFFRRNGLLFLDQDDLDRMADRLAQVQPFLGVLARDPTLTGLFGLLGKALDAEKEGAADLSLDPVLGAMAEVADAQAEGRFAVLSWRNLMSGEAPEKGRRFLVVEPKLDFGSLAPARAAMDEIRRAAAELRLTPDRGVRVRLTGEVALDEEELASVEEGMGFANVASLILVIGFLVIGLKDARLVLSVLATLLFGLAVSAALALAMMGKLNLISVAFAVLFIGLGVDFGIHFALRYREARDRGEAEKPAFAWAAETVGGPLALCATAAAIGFFSFIPTDYRGLAELGQIAGVSMFVAFIANLTLLPALITLLPPRLGTIDAPKGDSIPKARDRRARSRRVVAAAALAAVLSAAFIPWASFDFDPLHLKDPRSESMSTLMDIAKEPRNGPYGITVLASGLEEARALAARLRPLPGIGEVSSVADLLPAGQETKLESIASMGMMLTALFGKDPAPGPDDARRREALAELLGKLRAGGGKAAALAAALGRLPDKPEARAELERRLVGMAPRLLEDLRTALGATAIGLDDLPAELRRNQIAADGRVKLEIFPKENLDAPAALTRFVETVRSVAPAAAGGPVTIYEASRTVLRAFLEATLITLAGLLLMLAAMLRNARDVAMVFAPLLLAALMLVPVTVLGHLPFNFANVIVLPLLFGLGIANGIQFVARERLEGSGANLFRTSTPRAVLFSAFTTMVSFGSLAVSSHPGTSTMGLLLAIALTLTLACTLLVMPALMAVWPRRSMQGAEEASR